MPLIEAFTLEEEVQTSLWQERIVSVLSAFFGVVALVLSALGLYATLAYSVERRRRDIGLRIALGAAARHIAGLIWAELRFSLPLGIIAGVCGSFVILRAAQALLFGIPAFDPISMVLACAILLAAAICAATMPALHAMRVDPAEVLREQ
jgi:ABC-type antimicrobial peptide transport system permease subunit